MEIKIGIQNVAREIGLESDSSTAEIQKALASALSDGTPLVLTDTKGRTVMVPAASIAYLDLGQESLRRVGFGSV